MSRLKKPFKVAERFFQVAYQRYPKECVNVLVKPNTKKSTITEITDTAVGVAVAAPPT